MKVYKAPQDWSEDSGKFKIFLAGSIEMGKAIDWQKQLTNSLNDFDVVVLNPRRDDWDSSWKQEIDNPEFFEQVSWELHSQEMANLVVFNFDKDTQSPITLMELGLFHNKQCIVCCPKEYFRSGNVEITCKRYNIPFFNDFNDFTDYVVKRLSFLKL